MQQDVHVDLACVGETMALLVPDPPRAPHEADMFRREIGGAESNVAIHLQRLGAAASWHSALGTDAFGDYIISRLEGERVACRARRDPERVTGLYVKEVHDGCTTVRYYRDNSAASQLTASDIGGVLAVQPRVVHTTGITPALSAHNQRLVGQLWSDAKAAGTMLSFDINYRPALHEQAAASSLMELANGADIVFCGIDEAAALWGIDDPEELRRGMPGPSHLVIKRGSAGSSVHSPSGVDHCPAPQVDVVEAVGAGDAFAAGYLRGQLLDWQPAHCLGEGTRLAGEVLQVDGDLPPGPTDDLRT